VSVIVRRAVLADTGALADLMNQIIEAGGTTAITDPVSGKDLADWMASDARASAWHVAEDADGNLVGFQWIGPHTGLPPEACDIATFVQQGQTGLGIGSQLFEATANAARNLGYAWINAEIRADNSSGRAYYQSRGFRVWGLREDVRLGDGTLVAKVQTRFDLD